MRSIFITSSIILRKVVPLKKKFNLAEKSFAQFAYSREINLMEAGEETWKPHINNFTKKAYGNRKTVEKFKKDELIYEPL